MDDKTLTALKQSIEKWERNVVAETTDDFTTGATTCPLCGLFWRGGRCTGCPIKVKTGKPRCIDTPYMEAYTAGRVWRYDPFRTGFRAAAHAASREEVAFLRSLLPKAETAT